MPVEMRLGRSPKTGPHSLSQQRLDPDRDRPLELGYTWLVFVTDLAGIG